MPALPRQGCRWQRSCHTRMAGRPARRSRHVRRGRVRGTGLAGTDAGWTAPAAGRDAEDGRGRSGAPPAGAPEPRRKKPAGGATDRQSTDAAAPRSEGARGERARQEPATRGRRQPPAAPPAARGRMPSSKAGGRPVSGSLADGGASDGRASGRKRLSAVGRRGGLASCHSWRGAPRARGVVVRAMQMSIEGAGARSGVRCWRIWRRGGARSAGVGNLDRRAKFAAGRRCRAGELSSRQRIPRGRSAAAVAVLLASIGAPAGRFWSLPASSWAAAAGMRAMRSSGAKL
jgi:hypothetical protein